MSITTGLLNQTITTIYSTADDGYGDATLTSVYSNVPCRWQERTGLIIDKNGQEKQFTVEAWIGPDYTILVDYEILFGSETYVVIGREKHIGLGGEWDHTKLLLV